jgi:hypothetical protein
MGKHGRKIIESKFNRKIVTESYLKVIKSMWFYIEFFLLFVTIK